MRLVIQGFICALLVTMSSGAPVIAQSQGTPSATPGAMLEPQTLTAEHLAELDAYIATMLEKTQIPGAAVAIVQNGQVIYENGFGVREVDQPEPVTPETLMMIGSVTKSMTATMAATLVDAGRLRWDTPVVDLLPGFAVADPDLTQAMIVRNAFCACTGLPQRDADFILNSDDYTPESLIASVAAFPLAAPLGKLFQYSNQMFAIGGYAATAAASGETDDLYDAYVRVMGEQLLAPLGMTRSTFSLEEVEASGDYAGSHGRELSGAYVPVALDDEDSFVRAVAPAGALWSSAAEMAHYVQMELGRGVGPDGTRVVSAENLDATWQSQVAIPAPPATGGGEDLPPELVAMGQGYALGWLIGDYGGERLLTHSGETFGFGAQVALLPDADFGI
nr:beta-lactamase family protein [Chloroflexia bacterium]